MNEKFNAEMVREYGGRIRALEEQTRALVVTPGQYLLREVFFKTGIADNTATSILKITTTNESGSTDGGGYVCKVYALIGHGLGSTSSNTAGKSFLAHFVRVLKSDGTGANSAVSEISESASAATTSATRDISTVTMTVTNPSDAYNTEIQFQIDATGSSVATAQVICVVELLYYGFTTPPYLTQM